jgi:hypothetical protein
MVGGWGTGGWLHLQVSNISYERIKIKNKYIKI